MHERGAHAHYTAADGSERDQRQESSVEEPRSERNAEGGSALYTRHRSEGHIVTQYRRKTDESVRFVARAIDRGMDSYASKSSDRQGRTLPLRLYTRERATRTACLHGLVQSVCAGDVETIASIFSPVAMLQKWYVGGPVGVSGGILMTTYPYGPGGLSP